MILPSKTQCNRFNDGWTASSKNELSQEHTYKSNIVLTAKDSKEVQSIAKRAHNISKYEPRDDTLEVKSTIFWSFWQNDILRITHIYLINSHSKIIEKAYFLFLFSCSHKCQIETY